MHDKKAIFNVGVETWNRDYEQGRWEYLKDLQQVAHYAVQAAIIAHLQSQRSILDVGCGEGILQENLLRWGYEHYLGIDISEAAIKKAALKQNDRTRFMIADATTFIPSQNYSCVIFNESLYYFTDPVGTMEHYERWLIEKGVFVVSIFLSAQTIELMLRLKERFDVVYETLITNEKSSWNCIVLTSKQAR